MTYKIPLFDLNFDERESLAVAEAIKDNWISTGPRCKAFEERFANMLNVKYAVSTSNCTASLHLALKLIGVCPGDEVICPSLTFVATVNAIRYVDAVPVFADVTSYENPTIDPDEIQRKITSKTKAVIVMHYGGFSCNMDRIIGICNKNNIKIVEDACHGPLSEYHGKKLGTIGDIGCFSFFSNKNISTGEGGMITTNSKEYSERALLMRSHGMTTMSFERSKGHSTEYDVIELGYNYRMDDIHAAIGLVQLDKIEEDLSKRILVRQMYLNNLLSIDRIIIPFSKYKEFSSNYIFPIVLKNSNVELRDIVRKRLAEEGIQTSIHYPSVHRFSVYKSFYTELPATDYLSRNMITLPMYSKLKEKDIVYISEKLKSIIRESM